MRKFLPRFLNALCFIASMLILLEWNLTSDLFNAWAYKPSLYVLRQISNVLLYKNYFRTFYLPCFMLAISFICLIASSIDRGIKKNEKKSSRALENAIYAPLICFTIVCSILGFIKLFIFRSNGSIFHVNEYDYFYLGGYLYLIPYIGKYIQASYSYIGGMVFYGSLIVLMLLITLLTTKSYKRCFILKLIKWVLLVVVAFASYKGLADMYDTIADPSYQIFMIAPSGYLSIPWSKLTAALFYGSLLAYFIIYILISSLIKAKNDKDSTVVEESVDESTTDQTIDSPFDVKKYQDMVKREFDSNPLSSIDESIYNLPKEEEIIDTVVEEKTVIKQIVFEPNNLDELFRTEFKFKNCTMVRNSGSIDYFVNRIKFLTILANGKSIIFRLDLDKAIRLMIQYPLIGKDKYEDHKIWFRIDDSSVMPTDVLIGIVKDAYLAVLNND